MPTVGEEVLLINHFGSFLVEEVDVEAKTAALRRLDSDALIKDVEWSTIWPLDDKTREVIAGLKSEATIELLRKSFGERNKRK
jgi:hypothetical protein